jgi:acryloyl-coenzyme A reductase
MAILKELDFIGSGHATLADLRQVIDLVACGKVSPDIANFVPLEDASSAHQMIEDRKISGRVVLVHQIVGLNA